MAVPFLTPSRCVLMIGDEGLHVYDVGYQAARPVGMIPWEEEGFESRVSEVISRECKNKPVLILNDMTDQHFKGGQRLPRVGPLDRANVLSRKLQVAFPNYPIRGALQIKPPKKGGDLSPDEKRESLFQSGLYLFAAVPMSDPIAKTMDAVRRSTAAIAGFYLLPIESSDMVAALGARLAGKTRKVSRWVVFVGQHSNGALRQVITRDGQLAMTRMTPLGDGREMSDESWAQEVSQEFKATISYLSRFGFSAQDGLDVIVICNQQAGEFLESLIDMPCTYTAMTVSEAARALGINLGVQENQRFADPLHAAWAGRKTRFILPMQASDLTRIHRPRQAASVLIFLLLLGGAYMSWQAAVQIQALFTLHDDLSTQRVILTRAEKDYQEEMAQINALGFNLRLIQGSIKTFDSLEKKRIPALDMIARIDRALGEEIRLDSLKIGYVPDSDLTARRLAPAYGQVQEEADLNPEMVATLKFSFPPSIDPEYGVRQVAGLKRRLENEIPGFNVIITKNVAGLEYSDAISGTAGRSSARQVTASDYEAEITIKGELK